MTPSDETAALQRRHRTRVLSATAAVIAEAAAAAGRGEAIVFPTDTVYGVSTTPFSETAVQHLYQIKDRQPEKGIPVLLAAAEDLKLVALAVPDAAMSLMARFWPGPLTLIVPRRPDLPHSLAPNPHIAVRIPDNDIARAIIRAAGGALATTSANTSGQEPARTAEQARAALDGLVSIIVDGGHAGNSEPSTIVDCTGEALRVLREGPITAAQLGLGAEDGR